MALDLDDLIEALDRRPRFIEESLDTAAALQADDRWAHLVVVSGQVNGWGEESVASSWPNPPVHRRAMATVPTGGLL